MTTIINQSVTKNHEREVEKHEEVSRETVPNEVFVSLQPQDVAFDDLHCLSDCPSTAPEILLLNEETLHLRIPLTHRKLEYKFTDLSVKVAAK